MRSAPKPTLAATRQVRIEPVCQPTVIQVRTPPFSSKETRSAESPDSSGPPGTVAQQIKTTQTSPNARGRPEPVAPPTEPNFQFAGAAFGLVRFRKLRSKGAPGNHQKPHHRRKLPTSCKLFLVGFSDRIAKPPVNFEPHSAVSVSI